ncbi:MAG: glycosyltransferase [Planctomycetes bacterium]|nr:glycosyltransferase [Planctomycetota bacterium]
MIDAPDPLVSRPPILYVITDLNTGGVPLHLLRLAEGIRDRGFEPHVISLAPPGPVSVQLRQRGIATYDCRAAGSWDLAVIRRLVRHIRRIKPALVHSFLFHANLAARLAVPAAGGSHRRLICEIQTVEIERRWHLTVGGMTHRMSRWIVGNSPSVIDHLHRRAWVSRSRLRCIPGGVDAESIRRAAPADRSALGLRKDRPIVLWVGRMDPVKGLDELIAAFAVVIKQTPAELVLVGDGAYAAPVRAMINRLRLTDTVRQLGRRDDVASLLKLADVFAFPSRTEGMPNALLEAMAAGCPIVTTDVPGCRDVVEHERTALIVPSGHSPSLADAIVRLLNDRALARRLGDHASRQVDAQFTFDRCLDRYESLYRELLSEPAGQHVHLGPQSIL